MSAWDLHWNDLSEKHRDAIRDAVDGLSCPCCGNSGQLAIVALEAVVDVIKDRDRAEILATMES